MHIQNLQCGRFKCSLAKPLVMGVLNLTPDSFSDGGRYNTVDSALLRAETLLSEGADIVDIGGESTRPDARPTPLEEELARVLPVLRRLLSLGVPISVDTRKAQVMQAAIAEGADMINDIGALEDEGALEVVAASAVAVCLMHKQGEPQTMQQAPSYVDPVTEVRDYLIDRANLAMQAGITSDRIVVDPGFGFGKTLAHNLALLKQLPALAELGLPLLVGLSRKSMLGALTGAPVEQRQSASVAAALLAVQRGADIVRVHDVRATRDALKILEAMET